MLHLPCFVVFPGFKGRADHPHNRGAPCASALDGMKRPPALTTIATTVAPCAATRARIMYCASTLLPAMNAPNPTLRTPAVVKQPAHVAREQRTCSDWGQVMYGGEWRTDRDPRLLVAALHEREPLLGFDELGLVQGRRLLARRRLIHGRWGSSWHYKRTKRGQDFSDVS
jgi:hypothetical protein